MNFENGGDNMFWKKKNEANNTSANAVNSNEYEKLSKRIAELDAEVRICKTSCQMLETDVANLRGKFNQRLKGLAPIEEKKEEKPEEKKIETINNSELVAFG